MSTLFTSDITNVFILCDAFGLSLSQFFLEDDTQAIVLNEKQTLLLDSAAKLAPEQYDALLKFLQTL